MNPHSATHHSDGTTTIALTGEIDAHTVSTAQQSLLDAITVSGDVHLDLRAVTFIDSAGLRMIQVVAAHILGTRRHVTLIAPPDTPARRLLEITGLTDVVPVTDTGPADIR
jgi:anti-anti-sigma factor